MAHDKRAEIQELIAVKAQALESEETVIKKPRRFLRLADVHPNASLDFSINHKSPSKSLEAAAKTLKRKIAKAPRLSNSSR